GARGPSASDHLNPKVTSIDRIRVGVSVSVGVGDSSPVSEDLLVSEQRDSSEGLAGSNHDRTRQGTRTSPDTLRFRLPRRLRTQRNFGIRRVQGRGPAHMSLLLPVQAASCDPAGEPTVIWVPDGGVPSK